MVNEVTKDHFEGLAVERVGHGGKKPLVRKKNKGKRSRELGEGEAVNLEECE